MTEKIEDWQYISEFLTDYFSNVETEEELLRFITGFMESRKEPIPPHKVLKMKMKVFRKQLENQESKLYKTVFR